MKLFSSIAPLGLLCGIYSLHCVLNSGQVLAIEFFLGNSTIPIKEVDAPHYAHYNTSFDVTLDVYFMTDTELQECTLKEISAKGTVLLIRTGGRLCESFDLYIACMKVGCAAQIWFWTATPTVASWSSHTVRQPLPSRLDHHHRYQEPDPSSAVGVASWSTTPLSSLCVTVRRRSRESVAAGTIWDEQR